MLFKGYRTDGAVEGISGFRGAWTTHTGTLRPSGMKSVSGTILLGSYFRPFPNSCASIQFSTKTSTAGHEYGRNSEFSSVRTPSFLMIGVSPGQLSPLRIR